MQGHVGARPLAAQSPARARVAGAGHRVRSPCEQQRCVLLLAQLAPAEVQDLLFGSSCGAQRQSQARAAHMAGWLAMLE